MNIEAKDVAEMKQIFIAQMEEGTKWVAFRRDEEKCVDKQDLYFFKSCNDAQAFCDKLSNPKTYYLFGNLETLLNQLENKQSMIQLPADEIYQAFQKRPIDFMFELPLDKEIDEISRGEFVPVCYQKNFVPCDEVGDYHIIELTGYRGEVPEIIKITSDPEKAKQIFNDEIDMAIKDPFRREHSFLLIGEFKSRSLKLMQDATPTNDTGLLFRMTSPIYDEYGIARHSDYKTLNETGEATFLFQGIFMKYDEQSRTLTFYNDKLEHVNDPMKVWSYLDVRSYDNKRAVAIKGANIGNEQRQTHAYKSKHHLR